MKKWLIVIGLLVSIVGAACAEKLSRRYIAVIQSNGHWEYTSVNDTDDLVWVKVINPRTNGIYEQQWNVKPRKSGKTNDKVSNNKDELEQISYSTDDIWDVQYYAFTSNYRDYAIAGDFVKVWHRKSFSGIGLCFSIVMKDEVDERSCVESFLNELKSYL